MKPIFFGSSIFCCICMIIESIPNLNKKVAKLKQKKQHNCMKPSKMFYPGKDENNLFYY